MGTLTYILIAIGLLVGGIVGWVFRHSLLSRQLTQSRKQLEEANALKLNMDHELSSVRQKLIQQSDDHKKMQKIADALEEQEQSKRVLERKIEVLEEQIASVNQDNEELQEQYAYLEAEKASWQKYRNQAQEEVEQVRAENKQLRETILGLQRDAPGIAKMQPLGVAPAVRRIAPETLTGKRKDALPSEIVKDKEPTSRIKSREVESTDRVNTRQDEAASERSVGSAKSDASPAPTSAIPIRQKPKQTEQPEMEPAQVEFVAGRIEEKYGHLRETPIDMSVEPIDEDSARKSLEVGETHFDEDTGIRDLSQKEKLPGASKKKPDTAPVVKQKKKPRTVRIDRSSSDIIDSFKRDLGLPGK